MTHAPYKLSNDGLFVMRWDDRRNDYLTADMVNDFAALCFWHNTRRKDTK